MEYNAKGSTTKPPPPKKNIKKGELCGQFYDRNFGTCAKGLQCKQKDSGGLVISGRPMECL